jgi:hypothetical protein
MWHKRKTRDLLGASTSLVAGYRPSVSSTRCIRVQDAKGTLQKWDTLFTPLYRTSFVAFGAD